MDKEKIIKILEDYEFFVDDDFGGHYEHINCSQKALTPLGILAILDYISNLEQQCKKQKEVINKVNKYLNEYDVFKVFSFPLMKRWEEEQVKSSIDYEFKTSLVKDLKDILKEVSE